MSHPFFNSESRPKAARRLYIESYGCQMNLADSEIVVSILEKEGFELTTDVEAADLVLLNTCSIREKAEQSVRNRIAQLRGLKKRNKDIIIGVLGCMAERLKKRLLEEEQVVDLVAGPDAYRDLAHLIRTVEQGHAAVNTFLSREETYADINPVRFSSNGLTAFISIMRGCNNMCSFCVVPFTRGRERSRDPHSIVEEAQRLFEEGYREVTLLGQNVDSYRWTPTLSEGILDSSAVDFAKLLENVAQIDPRLRVRFSTSHPKDITDQVLYTMAHYDNICKHIHLPAQSGNSEVLRRMNRGYTRTWYMEKVDRIREILGPKVGLSSDIIAGFCGETEEEHQDTLTLMEYAQYDFSYMFCYSERPGTPAAKKMQDDVPEEIKKRRLQEIIQKQGEISLRRNKLDMGQQFQVLIEGPSKRSEKEFQGRNSANKVVILPCENVSKGDYVTVQITDCTAASLRGELALQPHLAS